MAWAQYVHPEFGYFCPTPRLRRELRIAFASILVGAISGAAGVIALSAGHRNADPPTVASVVTSQTPITAPLLNGDEMSAAAQGYNRLEGGLITTDGLRAKNDTASARDKTDAAMTACRDMSGPCLAGTPRRARVGAATDGPDVARLPLGRPAATPAGITAKAPDGTPEELQGSAPDNATAATPPSAENGAQDRAHSSRVLPKKPQKTARSEGRHRNDPGNDPWREERADPWGGRVYTNDNGGERLGRVSTRDVSSARRGFWDWSR
jgi:hypothetical protein